MRDPLNHEMPDRVPSRLINVPVIARLVSPDAEEWRPATANRWTKTYVLVTWVEDGQPRERLVRLRADDVTRVICRPLSCMTA